MNNGLAVYLEATNEWVQSDDILNIIVLVLVLVLGGLFVHCNVGGAGQPGEMLRSEGSKEDLLEILDIDGTIPFMKGKKGFITFFVQKRHPLTGSFL